jgi:hypothetical protein
VLSCIAEQYRSLLMQNNCHGFYLPKAIRGFDQDVKRVGVCGQRWLSGCDRNWTLEIRLLAPSCPPPHYSGPILKLRLPDLADPAVLSSSASSISLLLRDPAPIRHAKRSNMCLPCFSFSNAQYERGNRVPLRQYQYVWNGQTWVLRDTVSFCSHV